VNVRGRAIALAALLGVGLVLGSGILAQQQSPVPDAPTPQAPTALPGTQGPITPGMGSGETPSGPGSSSASQPQQPPVSQQPAEPPPQVNAHDAPPEEGIAAVKASFTSHTTEVIVPVTVKDPKGNPVAGLTWRDFTVYENNTRSHIAVFSVDPTPISVAFVIDQTLPSNYMREVNESLNASFTGAQGTRLPAVLSLAQSTGTDPMVPIDSGPFASCAATENGNCVSPVLQQGGSTASPCFISLPKEIHTLNDAILQAGRELSTRPQGRLRVIYVISDGKEYGSQASTREVVKYLQTNKTAVYATLVGDSAHWGEGWLDRFHLPGTVADNILYKYTVATGGDTDAEGGVNGIEKSYAKIADEARNEYTLGYLSHTPVLDERYRNIDVRVDRPDLQIIAKHGYYPSAQDYK
jgi:VWFA-related protein